MADLKFEEGLASEMEAAPGEAASTPLPAPSLVTETAQPRDGRGATGGERSQRGSNGRDGAA